jgi:hypothetical protein
VDPAVCGTAKRPTVLHPEILVHGRVSSRYVKIDTDLGDVLHRPRSPTYLRILYTELSDASGVALDYADDVKTPLNGEHCLERPRHTVCQTRVLMESIAWVKYYGDGSGTVNESLEPSRSVPTI